MNKNNLNQGCR